MNRLALVGMTTALVLSGTAALAQTTLRIGLAEDPDVLDPTLARSFVGRIVFAGSDIANGWSGFIDGAIESGFRGAALALGAMTSHRRAA